MENNELLKFLNDDPFYISVTDSLRFEDCKVTKRNDSFCCYVKNANIAYVWGNPQDFPKLGEDMDNVIFCAVGYSPDALTHLCPPFAKETYQYAYLKGTPPQSNMDIRPLDLSHADYVTRNYFNNPSERAEKSINGKGMLGAFDKDKIIGFIGRHEEGSMGMLFIEQSYRRRGIGRELEKAMISQVISLGRVPRADIYTDNFSSINLQESLGLSRVSNATWYSLTEKE